MTNCWNKILDSLSTRVDNFDFKVWLAPIVAQTGERSLTLCLQGASKYMLHRLEVKMGGLIRATAAQIFGCRPEEVAMTIGAAAPLPGIRAQNSPVRAPAEVAGKEREQAAQKASEQVQATNKVQAEQGEVQAETSAQAQAAQTPHQAQSQPQVAARTAVRAGTAAARIARAQARQSATQGKTAQATPGHGESQRAGTAQKAAPRAAQKPCASTDAKVPGAPGQEAETRSCSARAEKPARAKAASCASEAASGPEKTEKAAEKPAEKPARTKKTARAGTLPSLTGTTQASPMAAVPAATDKPQASTVSAQKASMSPFVAASMQAQAFAAPVTPMPMGAMVTDNGNRTPTMAAMAGTMSGSMAGMPSITTVGADGGRSTYTMAAQPLVRSLPLDQAATLSGDALNRKQWRYTFADFVVGPTNALALSAAQDVCRPKSFVETLFVSSEPGLGKTHIVQSAVRQILEDRGPSARVAYLTAEDFYARFRMGLRNDSLDDFTSKVRALDFLLIDDVQFLFGKHKTQELLMSLVKQLQGKGSKVVITSRFLSRDLVKDLDSQLVSLIASGVQASMDAPDYTMRCEIVRRKAATHGISLDEEVVALLASHLEGDVRRIESCLQTLFLRMKVMNVGASPDLALEVLSKFGCTQEKTDAPLPTFEDFMGYVSQCYGLTQSQICSCIRRRNFVEARNVLFYLARKHTSMTLAQIGAKVNKRHSTVIKGIASIEHSLTSQTKSGRQTAHLVELIEKNAGCARSA